MKLKNKVALVTGASRGFGRAIAIKFAKEGANVIINYHQNSDAAEHVKKEIEKEGSHTLLIKADVSKKKWSEKNVWKNNKNF